MNHVQQFTSTPRYDPPGLQLFFAISAGALANRVNLLEMMMMSPQYIAISRMDSTPRSSTPNIPHSLEWTTYAAPGLFQSYSPRKSHHGFEPGHNCCLSQESRLLPRYGEPSLMPRPQLHGFRRVTARLLPLHSTVAALPVSPQCNRESSTTIPRRRYRCRCLLALGRSSQNSMCGAFLEEGRICSWSRLSIRSTASSTAPDLSLESTSSRPRASRCHRGFAGYMPRIRRGADHWRARTASRELSGGRSDISGTPSRHARSCSQAVGTK